VRRTLCIFAAVSLVVGFLLLGAVGCRRAKPRPTITLAPTLVTTRKIAAVAQATGTKAPAVVTSPTMPATLPPTLPPTPTPLPTTAVPTQTPPVVTVTPTPAGSPSPTTVPVPTEFNYTVQWGDSLWSLAQRFGTTVEDIANRNEIYDYNVLRVGQVLKIKGVPSATPLPPTTYVVQRGDNLSNIAVRFGTTVETLRRMNGIVNPSLIYVGQVLKVPAAGGGGTETSETAKRYIVRPGDTLFSIAQAHNTTVWSIRIANNIPNPNWIYVGQVLVIP